MLAGAGGIDFALLAVAADDGCMPQTFEHLAIVDLLGIRRGIVALTKADIVRRNGSLPSRRRSGGAAAARPSSATEIIPVSAVTGQGMDGAAGAAFRRCTRGRSAVRLPGRFRLAVTVVSRLPEPASWSRGPCSRARSASAIMSSSAPQACGTRARPARPEPRRRARAAPANAARSISRATALPRTPSSAAMSRSIRRFTRRPTGSTPACACWEARRACRPVVSRPPASCGCRSRRADRASGGRRVLPGGDATVNSCSIVRSPPR